ncbi:DUF1080 domain-containing protein [Mucilaginibacter dorajii]|uniref:3-keto-disaccharide hydrolase domain-containing protein n=1 Tax=Mucilaginibacter dorajii TaxID=692994 RepID=A0ABP7P283_9SPHI|nr:DUF1080 domain-containing protein [Mucilaginibacter dorajii]MCS3737016.1 hypothetical protein [Mucilaginibacter dorajii]
MKNLLVFIPLLAFICVNAQQKYVVHDLSVIKPKEWVIPQNDTIQYEFGSYKNQKALMVQRKIGDYKAGTPIYPTNLNFRDGIIECDLAFAGKGNAYIGLAFRIKDAHHYETLYFRPLSSGTINAIQYMPEKKADFNWWDYEADKYQAKAILPHNDWFHVKLIVTGSKLEVYVNNAPKPAMVYSSLDPSLKNGSVGYWHGNSGLSAYKNLVVKLLK